MSASGIVVPNLTVQHSLLGGPPKFVAAINEGLARCHADGLDAYSYETLRSHDLAVAYYARGRTVKPPFRTVTNAPDETYGWHGFFLADDIISAKLLWGASEEWFQRVAHHMKSGGLIKSGIDWKQHDAPHHQWGRCKPSPSDEARRILKLEGMRGVWRAVGAL